MQRHVRKDICEIFERAFSQNTIGWLISFLFRSIHPEVFCETGPLEHFEKLTGKQLCRSLFFNRVAGKNQLHFLNRFCIAIPSEAATGCVL